MSEDWQVYPGSKMLHLGPVLICFSYRTLRYSKSRLTKSVTSHAQDTTAFQQSFFLLILLFFFATGGHRLLAGHV